jgi:hypothetical protein
VRLRLPIFPSAPVVRRYTNTNTNTTTAAAAAAATSSIRN